MQTNEKLTKGLQNQITENKNEINKLYGIQYISERTITPKVNCYAEVYGCFSGWGYGGNSTNIGIVNTKGNAVEIARANNNIKGHDTVPDAGMCMAVYQLNANTTYEFSITGLSGGNTAINLLTKLVPIQ